MENRRPLGPTTLPPNTSPFTAPPAPPPPAASAGVGESSSGISNLGAVADSALAPRLRTSALRFLSLPQATTEIYTLSLHDALPISTGGSRVDDIPRDAGAILAIHRDCRAERDRKSTRLNSSHVAISYAVFCLK